MRLNEFEIDTINKLAKKHFGDGTSVYLFGSRTDDRKKGGDIDLFICNDNEEVLTLLRQKWGFRQRQNIETNKKRLFKLISYMKTFNLQRCASCVLKGFCRGG